jgi:hypothetical protein
MMSDYRDWLFGSANSKVAVTIETLDLTQEDREKRISELLVKAKRK